MKVLIFGITGSIGSQTLQVIEEIDTIELVGFSFFENINKAKKIKNKFSNSFIYSPSNKEINNVDSFNELIIKSKPDIIVNAISGFAGLEISILAIEHSINLALANKESIVTAGYFLINMAKLNNVSIIPIDSEISSVYSIYEGKEKINKIILTCSGGKYFHKDLNNLHNPSFKEVIQHPKWSMGEKISIDSSTMVNKYFEMIEAYYIFDCNIEVIQHDEAIVHAMIEYKDGSIKMYASKPDMRLSIQNSLTNFKSNQNLIGNLNIDNLNLKFRKIDDQKWLPIKWANEFFISNNLATPIIINAANDALFYLFKNNKINFEDIIPSIQLALNDFAFINIENIEDIFKLNNLVKDKILSKNYD